MSDISPELRSTMREAEVAAVMAEWRDTELARISSLTALLRIFRQQMISPTPMDDGTYLSGYASEEIADMVPYLLDRIWPISYDGLDERVDDLTERVWDIEEDLEAGMEVDDDDEDR